MKSHFFPLLALFIACNAAGPDQTMLTQPPYDKLTDTIRQQPAAAGPRYRRGVLLYQNNKAAAAVLDLKQAWLLEPSEQHALSVVTALRSQSVDSAIRFIQRALPQLPQSVALHIALARGFQQKNELQKALDVCDRVLLIYPTSLDALLLKTELLKTQHNDSAALATLETAHRYAPFDPELNYNLLFEYAQAKNNKAISLADSLIRTDVTGKQPQPYYLKGVYFANTGNAAQAFYFYDQAIARDYTFFDAHMDKGALLFEQQKFSEALSVFERVAQITPTYAESYYWAGRCQQALGKTAAAKLSYQRAYGLDKTMTEAAEAAAKL